MNFRRSVLAAKESARLHQEAKVAYVKAQQHCDEAAQARLEAKQAREAVANELAQLKRYWELERLN